MTRIENIFFWQNPTRVWILVCSEVHTLIKEAFCEIWSDFFFYRSQRYPQLIAALSDNKLHNFLGLQLTVGYIIQCFNFKGSLTLRHSAN